MHDHVMIVLAFLLFIASLIAAAAVLRISSSWAAVLAVAALGFVLGCAALVTQQRRRV